MTAAAGFDCSPPLFDSFPTDAMLPTILAPAEPPHRE